MQRDQDRDKSVERVLRKTLRATPALRAAQDACLDGETLAAWTGGALSPARVAVVEAHLSDCPRCQALMATFAQTASAAPVSSKSFAQRWRLRWLVPIAAAATAVAIWIAVPTEQPSGVVQESDVVVAPAIPSTEPASPVVEPPLVLPLEKRQDAADQAAGGTTLDSLRQSEKEADATEAPIAREERPVNAIPTDSAAASNRTLGAQAAGAPPPSTIAAPERREVSLLREAVAPVEIVSPSPVNRWRIIDGTRVERSTTGGTTWEAPTVNAPGEFAAGSSPDPLVCWLVGRAGAVRLTVDGLRFDSVPFPESVDLVAVRASSATSAVVTTADGRQLRTDDRGQTWVRVMP